MNKTGILFFPAFDWAISETHPEREERLLYTQEQITEEGILDLPQIVQFPPTIASVSSVMLTQGLFPKPDVHDLNAHLVASGSSISLGEAWANGYISNGFALIRPPGHHAKATVWGNRGFCTLNNTAILVNHLRAKFNIKKVAIIDTDVHHGDGTQDIFYHDPNVLFISIHQDGRTLYPGSGFIHEKGGPNAWDKTLNIPLPPGAGDDAYHYVIENWVLPQVNAFGPELVINSAGQDCHFTDPLASMNVSARGYAKIAELLKPNLAINEGGYSIEGALPYTNLAILLALAGQDYSGVQESQIPHRPSLTYDVYKSYLKDLKKEHVKVKPDWKVIKEKYLPQGDWVYIPQSIYYDTEGFNEFRNDRIRLCSECGGTVLYDSHLESRNMKSTLVRIPFRACNTCEQAGFDLWEYFIGRRESVLLQDQKNKQMRFWHIQEGVKIFEFFHPDS